MPPLIWDRRPRGLRSPAMICAFQGWNDAGDSASGAVVFFVSALKARRFARIDSQEFYDFQANRPYIRLSEDAGARSSGRRWRCSKRTPPGPSRPRARAGHRALDALAGVLLAHRRPRRSARGRDRDPLGALLADVAHSRPVTMTGHASDPALMEASVSPSSAMRGQPGSSGCSTPPARRRGFPPRACGRASPTMSPPPPTRRRRWHCAPGGKHRRGLGGRQRARGLRRRLRAPGGARRTERLRHPGFRRTPRAGGRQRGGAGAQRRAPRATCSSGNSSVFSSSAGSDGAPMAPCAGVSARRRGRRCGSRTASRPLSRASPEALREDALADLEAPLAHPLEVGRPGERDLEIVEYVVVGPARRLSCQDSLAASAYSESCVSCSSSWGCFGREVL